MQNRQLRASLVDHFPKDIFLSRDTYPNIHGYDCDIDQWPLSRFSLHQQYLWFHRFQYLYLWPLYGLYTIKWQFLDDFRPVVTGRLGLLPFRRPQREELARFVLGKIQFFCLAFAIPLSFHPMEAVLGLYVLVFYVNGLIFTIVVQLSHLVSHTDTPRPSSDGNFLDTDWAVHQARASCDFCQDNKLLSWFLGGLNFQVEHHLFPTVCHMHYAGMAPIVKSVCLERSIPYNTHSSLIEGLRSHHHHLRSLAQQPLDTTSPSR
jgi:linoleoyl-CoA desaturase